MRIIYMSCEDMRKKGAGKTHFKEVAINLANAGNELLVLLPGYQPRQKIEDLQTVRYIPTLKKNFLSYILYEILHPFFLFAFIIKFKPHIIYFRQDLLNITSPVLAVLFRIPYIIEKNGLVGEDYRYRGFSDFLINILTLAEYINVHLAAGIICVTEGIKREITRKYAVNEAKLSVIPNGANTGLFYVMEKAECRRSLKIDENCFYVGFVGTFAPWQGLDLLIDAAYQIKEAGFADIKYLLVGDGELEEKIKEKAAGLGLHDIVHFTGRVDYEKVPEWINTFDLAVAPFTRERNDICGLSPIKIYEYLACGKPVLAADVEGVREIIEENKCGFLFKPDDKSQLADKIIWCYQNRQELENAGSRGARIVRERFTWRNTAEMVARVLESASG